MNGLRIVGSAFGTLRVVDTVKEILPVVPEPPLKSVLAGGVAAGLVVLSGERDPARIAVEALAAAGLAGVLHDVQTAAQRFVDNQVTQVLSRVQPRAQPQRRPAARPGPLGS